MASLGPVCPGERAETKPLSSDLQRSPASGMKSVEGNFWQRRATSRPSPSPATSCPYETALLCCPLGKGGIRPCRSHPLAFLQASPGETSAHMCTKPPGGESYLNLWFRDLCRAPKGTIPVHGRGCLVTAIPLQRPSELSHENYPAPKTKSEPPKHGPGTLAPALP